ncbi:MAG: adenosylcobyric acid synthase [Clostridiales bacterium]|nr:adenosylcobyric acid synthase [Clostridiales bacterium]
MKILVIGGTADGRKLLEELSCDGAGNKRFTIDVCVAGTAGAAAIEHLADRLTIHTGRLDADGFAKLMRIRETELVIDCSHPYAAEVSRQLMQACEKLGIPCWRLNRSGQLDGLQKNNNLTPESVDVEIVDNPEQAIAAANRSTSNILLTTGSKDLAVYAAGISDFSERVYVRVLPVAEAIASCRAAGVRTDHIIAWQGPFDTELNQATIRRYNIKLMITKDGGDQSGFLAKAAAAAREGVRLLVIGRPQQQLNWNRTFAGVDEIVRACTGRVPAIMLAGTGSGCGKTTITMALLAALRRSGRSVRPFKTGPDYIDPMFHKLAGGKCSHNLDSWLLEPTVIKQIFAQNMRSDDKGKQPDMALIEGVMGLYDGLGNSLEGSSALLANILDLPIVLLIDGSGLALSICAMIEGYINFHRQTGSKIRGVILNRVTAGGFSYLKPLIEDKCRIQVLGFMPEMTDCELESRHLGLVQAMEDDQLASKIDKLAAAATESIDLDLLQQIANDGAVYQEQMASAQESAVIESVRRPCRIGVARDAAFSFYYEENLNLLRRLGAQLVFFSPLADNTLPPALDGLYIGGGYPELHAEKLAAKETLRSQIREAVLSGLPTVAECGGLLYMSEAVADMDGELHEMCGVLPLEVRMTTRLQNFGYQTITMLHDGLMGPAGTKIRAHEFHYSASSVAGSSCEITKPGGRKWTDCHHSDNYWISYSHIHFYSNPDMVRSWLAKCREYNLKQEACNSKAKPLMIQGTMSSSGKSLITAGLCRIFTQDGFKTSPFKSQNMALNSYITLDGLEMGRAQVLQAQACGLEPDVSMNPILLKPTSNTGSQLIVHGEVRGQYRAAEYFRMKKQLIPEILQAYSKNSTGQDYIVIEGAGSPAEINLKQQDIVNMGMAKMVDAPVLLLGDIDRGGVFASLYGTLAMLEPEERSRVRGLIINKFRGDVEILKPGLKMLEDLTGIPVVGVIPMIDLDLDDEDGESDRLKQTAMPAEKKLDIAVIRLPRISNFTDFNIFSQIPGVHLRYVHKTAGLGNPDLIILPGSKNTQADLNWLRETGLADSILAAAMGEAATKGSAGGVATSAAATEEAAGAVSATIGSAGGVASKAVPIVGICGGYQMLGQFLHDPDHVEQGGSSRGLGLLPGETTFAGSKIRTRTTARLFEENSGAVHGCNQEPIDSQISKIDGIITGYEIHMGRTEITDHERARPLLVLEDGRTDGMISSDGMVWGSYLHGIFDNPQMMLFLLRWLQQVSRPDWEFNDSVITELDAAAIREQELNKLASVMRDSLDLTAIYDIMNS